MAGPFYNPGLSFIIKAFAIYIVNPSFLDDRHSFYIVNYMERCVADTF